jgi:hypothetical protein
LFFLFIATKFIHSLSGVLIKFFYFLLLYWFWCCKRDKCY